MPDYKQVIVYNKNAKIPFNQCLKLIVLGAIDSVDKSLREHKDKVQSWLRFGQKKITLQVPTEVDLINIQNICSNKKITFVLMNDEHNTPCILVLGPELEKILDPITGTLKLF